MWCYVCLSAALPCCIKEPTPNQKLFRRVKLFSTTSDPGLHGWASYHSYGLNLRREITVRTENTQKTISLFPFCLSRHLQYLSTVSLGLQRNSVWWFVNSSSGVETKPEEGSPCGPAATPPLVWHSSSIYGSSACAAVTAHFQFAELREYNCRCLVVYNSPCRNISKEEVEV